MQVSYIMQNAVWKYASSNRWKIKNSSLSWNHQPIITGIWSEGGVFMLGLNCLKVSGTFYSAHKKKLSAPKQTKKVWSPITHPGWVGPCMVIFRKNWSPITGKKFWLCSGAESFFFWLLYIPSQCFTSHSVVNEHFVICYPQVVLSLEGLGNWEKH